MTHDTHGAVGVASGWLQRPVGPFADPAAATANAMDSELARRAGGFTLSATRFTPHGTHSYYWTPINVRPYGSGRIIGAWEYREGSWVEIGAELAQCRMDARLRGEAQNGDAQSGEALTEGGAK